MRRARLRVRLSAVVLAKERPTVSANPFTAAASATLEEKPITKAGKSR